MKRFSIRYATKALSDLEEVWDEVYEASQSYDTADRYIDDLLDKISEKASFPQSGIPLMYGMLFTGFYSVNFKKYKAFYRVNENYIDVARVLMCKCDYMKILFGDE